MKTVKQLLSQIKKNYMCAPKYNNWTSSYKEATKFIRKVVGISLHYSKVLGYTQQEVLQALEDKRKYWSANYYRFPRINSRVIIYNTLEDYHKDCPSGKFICPACNSISTSCDVCNSGKDMSPGKKCDWKAFGLFGTMGKGYKFIIKDEFLEEPHVYNIFMPIEKVEGEKHV